MKIDDILVMWEADCHVDDNHLDRASITTAKLHSKYIRMLADCKLKRTKLDHEYTSLRKMKFKYYRGEMTKEELSSAGWEQWQYSKPLKTEMDEFLKGDDDLAQFEMRIQYIDVCISTIDSILSQVKQRDWQIRNAIAWKQFIAGS